MDRFAPLRDATRTAILTKGVATDAQLRSLLLTGNAPPELASLVEKIRARAYTVTDEDVAALKLTYSEEQLFEIIVVAAFGAALERVTAAHSALDLA